MNFRIRPKHYLAKTLTVTLCCLVILCLVISCILYSRAIASTTTAILAAENERTNELIKQVDILLNDMSDTSAILSRTYYPTQSTDPNNTYWTKRILEHMLSSHIDTNSYTANIEINTQGYVRNPSPVSHDQFLGALPAFRTYTEATPQWPYYFDLEFSSQASYSKVTTTISAYHLSNQIFSSSNEHRTEYLVMKDGTVLLSSQRSAIFQNIDTLHPGTLSSAAHNAKAFETCGDMQYTVSVQGKYGLRVISMVNQSLYREEYALATRQTLYLSGLLLLAAILISYLLSLLFYRPVGRTVALLQTYIPENVKNYENEIAFINETISKYVPKGTELENKLPQAISKMKDAQAAVLQHQINSHFLFNTLENIKAISIEELGLDNDIETYITCLNNILRESIFQQNAIISLQDEVLLAKSYLSLMQMRFPGIQVSWSVDDTLLNSKVFKFTLQPILENCFLHAFKDRPGLDNTIHISVLRDENDLVLRVSDNGCGISPARLEQLDELLNAPLEAQNGAHVGIRNIQNRITTVFGKNYGITLRCTDGQTTVDIRYPSSHVHHSGHER